MRSLRTFTVLTSLTVGWVSAAFGGVSNTLSGSITPVFGVAQVSYSVESPKVMDANVGYVFALGNTTGGTATANNVSVTVTATASDPQEVVKLLLNPDSVLPAGCAKVSDNSFTCSVGQLKAGQSFPTFQMFFRAPTKVASPNNDGPNDAPGTDFVKIDMAWQYAERTNDQNPNSNSTGSAFNYSVLLGTPSPTQTKTAVLKSGGEYFTGVGGVPNSTDVYTSSVKFDPLSAIAELTIQETQFPATDATCIGGGHFKTCYATLLTAPQVLYTPGAGFLTEVIRVHPDNFVKGAKADTVTWEYTPTDANGTPVGPAVNVGMCASPTTPRSDFVPCQAVPVTCAKKSDGGVCEYRFINRSNGFQRGY